MKLKAKTVEEFIKQFEIFLDSDNAKNQQGIVYIWRTEKPIKRVKGESRIIYIGQTKNTFRDRYWNSRSLNIEKRYFEQCYKHMMDMYGPLTIEIIKSSNPKKQEWEKLKAYSSNHIEYPPLNRAIPNQPK